MAHTVATRRTACRACRGASCRPMVAEEGPVASGWVTPGTAEETSVPARLLDTPDLQHLYDDHRAAAARSGAPPVMSKCWHD